MKASKTLQILLFGSFLMMMNMVNSKASEDVNKLDMRNATLAAEGLYTGGQPSQSDFKKFAAMGVTTVINLRGKGEFDEFDEAKLASESGMTYQKIEISSGSQISKENALKLDQMLKQAKGEVVIHCASGNRVGALLALREFYTGKMDAKQAIAFGKKAGMTRLTGLVESVLSESESTK